MHCRKRGDQVDIPGANRPGYFIAFTMYRKRGHQGKHGRCIVVIASHIHSRTTGKPSGKKKRAKVRERERWTERNKYQWERREDREIERERRCNANLGRYMGPNTEGVQHRIMIAQGLRIKQIHVQAENTLN